MNTNTATLEPEWVDAMQCAARLAVMLVPSALIPGQNDDLPQWVRNCLSRVLTQSCGPKMGPAMNEGLTPYALGMILGSSVGHSKFVPQPNEKFMGETGALMDVYYDAFVSELNQRGIHLPENFSDVIQHMMVDGYENCTASQRLEFVEGLKAGQDFDRQCLSGDIRTTDASPVYFQLLLNWKEISAKNCLNDAYTFLTERFSHNPQCLGSFERFRKLANRIGLSFRGT